MPEPPAREASGGMWMAWALVAAVAAGATAILAKIGMRGVDTYLATALRTVVVLVFAWLMVAVVGSAGTLSQLSGRTLGFLAASGLATGASWLCYFRALQAGPVTGVAALDKSSTVLTMLLGIALLGESAAPLVWVGMALLAAGTALMVLPAHPQPRRSLPLTSVPQASVPQASVPGVPMPSVRVPNTSLPDASLPDASLPATSPPATSPTDVSVPDASVPDASVPDASVASVPLSDALPPVPPAAGAATPDAPPAAAPERHGTSHASARPAAASGTEPRGGIVAVSAERTATRAGRSWVWWAAGSAVFAALTAILGKVGIQNVESNLGTALRTCVVLVMAWALVFTLGRQHGMRKLTGRNWVFIALSGLATGVSWLAFYHALQQGPASVVVPIDKLSIVVTVAFAALVLRERVTRRTAVGLALLLAGTLLAALGQ